MSDAIGLFENNPYLGVIALLAIVTVYLYKENKYNKQNRMEELDSRIK